MKSAKAMRLLKRHRVRGRHGHSKIERQRFNQILMVATGLFRVVVWTAIMLAYVANIGFVRHWFASVSFVALLSIWALMLTDWGQVAASWAALIGSDVHGVVEETHETVHQDFTQLDGDVARLAELQPGIEAQQLAESIRSRLPTS